ncbi:hypothetical protein [Embleya sp. NPDC059237]|uniref:hypothetical protein n=1 Tax=Embleya sp. NPDC059237 TaxID=3346784 RepID=UPI003683EB9D
MTGNGSGRDNTRPELAKLRERAGERDGAERLAHETADAGNTIELAQVAALREEAGDRDGAERLRALLRRGLDADDESPVDR